MKAASIWLSTVNEFSCTAHRMIMKTNSWVPSGIVLVFIVLTANSVEIQDERSNKGIAEDGKLDYKNTESSISDDGWKTVENLEGGHKADKGDCDIYCSNSGECKIAEDGQKSCICKKGTSGYWCDTVDGCVNDYCGTNKDEVDCVYDEENQGPTCRCRDYHKTFIHRKKECRKTCDKTSVCKNEGTCDNDKICDCKPGTSGEMCEIIEECKDGKYKSCKGEYGECTFEAGKAVCKCKGEKKLDESKGQCRKPCDKDTDCENNAKCRENVGGIKFCACGPIYTGDTCGKITDCEEDGKYQSCRGENGECKVENGEAVCNCPEDKTLDKNAGYCKYKWCYPDPCRDNAVCYYDKKTETGTCNCTNANHYYDFGDYYNRCKVSDPDRCILLKKSCGENEKCERGYCECMDNYKRVGYKCEPDLCASNPCFSGATCDDKDGILKCFCGEGKYFDGEKCADGSCLLGDYKATCKEPCPENMERKSENKTCEPMKDFTLCSEHCGFGYCLQKKGEKEHTCSCISSISHDLYGGKTGPCVLNSEAVCPAKLYNQYAFQCNCTGKYKPSSNGITCELKTCLDESAQKDCKEKGTKCVMDGKQGYICACPAGYVMDEKRNMCTDPCSLEEKRKKCLESDQFCYNSLPKWNQQTQKNDNEECRCPPALKEVTKKDGWNRITECKDLAENVYIVTGIPVIKNRYEVQDKMKINKVLLNTDLISSMKSTFMYFDYGYLLDYELNGDVLNVSVWIQFRYEPSQEINRILLQAKSVNCDDCAWDLSLWPPNVLLDTKLLSGVSIEPLKFCSEKSKNVLCGKEAICQDNKCSCPRGFKTAEYSIIDNGKFRIERCEDVDECTLGTHSCSSNTTCVNVPGDYYCRCKANYKKEKDPVHSRVIRDKSDCYDLCTPNPCNNGTCMLKEDESFDCICPLGYKGSFCNTADVPLAKAKNNTVVVGAVLGTLFGVTLVALVALVLLYIRMKKNNSY